MKWFRIISEVEAGRNRLSLDMRQQTERVVIESVCIAIITNSG